MSESWGLLLRLTLLSLSKANTLCPWNQLFASPPLQLQFLWFFHLKTWTEGQFQPSSETNRRKDYHMCLVDPTQAKGWKILQDLRHGFHVVSTSNSPVRRGTLLFRPDTQEDQIITTRSCCHCPPFPCLYKINYSNYENIVVRVFSFLSVSSLLFS